MQKETKQTLAGLALVGSIFLSPLVISDVKKDSRAFYVDGRTVFVSQNRSHTGKLEMYTGMGFAGQRSFDTDNDGKLDFSQHEVGTPRRYPIISKTGITLARQDLYESVREQYLAGNGKIKGFVGIYDSIRNSVANLFNKIH